MHSADVLGADRRDVVRQVPSCDGGRLTRHHLLAELNRRGPEFDLHVVLASRDRYRRRLVANAAHVECERAFRRLQREPTVRGRKRSRAGPCDDDAGPANGRARVEVGYGSAQ